MQHGGGGGVDTCERGQDGIFGLEQGGDTLLQSKSVPYSQTGRAFERALWEDQGLGNLGVRPGNLHPRPCRSGFVGFEFRQAHLQEDASRRRRQRSCSQKIACTQHSTIQRAGGVGGWLAFGLACEHFHLLSGSKGPRTGLLLIRSGGTRGSKCESSSRTLRWRAAGTSNESGDSGHAHRLGLLHAELHDPKLVRTD